jgi:hypothetical protein
VEIVARRIPKLKQEAYDGTNLSDTTKWEENFVAVFNRSLFVLDIPTYPATASTSANVTVDTFDSEEGVSKKSLGDDRISKARDALNALEAGSLSRGALARDHLSTAIVAKETVSMTGSNVTLSSDYPGWSTATRTSSSSGTGWYLLNDGGSSPTNLKTPGFSIATTSIFVILANIQARSVRSGQIIDYVDEFGAFTLGYEDAGGAFHVVPTSEAYINHYGGQHTFAGLGNDVGLDADDSLAFDEDIDVPIFAIVTSADISSATGGQNVNFFGIYGSTMASDKVTSSGVTARQPVLTWRRGNLTVIQLKV